MRDLLAQRMPDPDMDFSDFPVFIWPDEKQTFYRIAGEDPETGKSLGPWWFSNTGRGRFDLSGEWGTLYAGHDELAGILEKLGFYRAEGLPITYGMLKMLHIWKLSAPFTDTRLAAMCSIRSGSYGVTNEIGDSCPYNITQAWAERLADEVFHGIRYKTRFDTRVVCYGIALFGKAGAHDWNAEYLCDGADDRILKMFQDAGVTVIQPPTFSSMEVI